MPHKHGYAPNGAATKEWRAWHNMRARCRYQSTDRYARYGGRGIRVCPQWADPDTGFVQFLADVGEAPTPRHSIARIDNDGHYEPGNVEWQTATNQARNTSDNHTLTARGVTKTLAEWAAESGVSRGTILARLARGWPEERAISEPRQFVGSAGARHYLRHDGKRLTISAWARETGIQRTTIMRRISMGWTVKEALTVNPSAYHNRT